jgi:hypothetical protein
MATLFAFNESTVCSHYEGKMHSRSFRSLICITMRERNFVWTQAFWSMASAIRLTDDYRKCSKCPPWASTQDVSLLNIDGLTGGKIPGTRTNYQKSNLYSLLQVLLLTDFCSINSRLQFSQGSKCEVFKSDEGKGRGVGPSRPSHCPGNMLFENSWIARRKCGGTPSCMKGK